jgi:PAS domain S-box-containing protein
MQRLRDAENRKEIYSAGAIWFAVFAIAAAQNILAEAIGPAGASASTYGVAVGLVLRFGPARTRLLEAGTCIAILAGCIATGGGTPVSIALAIAAIVEFLVTIRLLRGRIVRQRGTSPMRLLWAFVVTAGVLAPGSGAVMAAALLWLLDIGDALSVAPRWFAAHAAAVSVMTPAIIAFGRKDAADIARSRSAIEAGLVFGGAVGVALLVFIQHSYPLTFLILPCLSLAAFRLSFGGATFTILTVTVLVTGLTVSGYGPIAHTIPTESGRAYLLDLFVAVCGLGNLPLASVLSERRGLHSSVAKSERLHRFLFEASNDMIVRIDLDGLLSYVSPASRNILGYEVEELVGTSFESYVHPDDLPQVALSFKPPGAGVMAYRHRMADGRYAWVEGNYRLVNGAGPGTPLEYIASIRDIGERKAAEEAADLARAQLEESNRLLTMAEALAGVGHWRLNAADESMFWSDEVYRIHGRSVGDTPTISEGLDAYHPEDREMVGTYVDSALNEGKSWSFIGRIVRSDGEERCVRSDAQVERSPDGKISGVFGTFLDITEQRKAEAELIAARDEAEQSAKAKSAFLATMTHEIRTPMTGVLGMIELLRSDIDLPDRERFFDSLQESAKLLMAVLNDVLDYSKIENGNVMLEDVSFDIGKLAQATINLFHNAASEKGLQVSLTCPVGSALLVRGDPIRIKQVMSNLISNAIKFTGDGLIELRLSMTPGHCGRHKWHVEVRDTGIGIDPSDAQNLFQPFIQADASTTRQFGGTGLGLAISRRLIEAMGGEIGMNSVPGQGSTFWFKIELGVAQLEATDLVDLQPAKPVRALSVLVAEDNLINQTLITALLERDGHKVVCVENGRLAVEAAATTHYDIILMDMQMPEMDGVTATKAIRAGRGPCGNIPIYAVTADTSTERRRLYENAGLSGFLTKPIDSNVLRDRLAGVAIEAGHGTIEDPTVAAVPLLDHERLRGLTSSLGATNVRRLLDLFDIEVRTRPTAIAGLLRGGEIVAARSQAHSLKGAALGVGALRLAHDSASIETAPDRSNDIDALSRQLEATATETLIALAGQSQSIVG